MKVLTKISIGFLSLAAVALWFTSCSSEDVASGTNQGRKSLLTLSINTGNVNNTRANDWIGSTTPTDEDKIQSMTVGIFDGDNVKTIVELPAGSGEGNKLESDGKKATIVTTSLKGTETVLVAVNAPKATFQGVLTASAFKEKTVEADVALCGGAVGDKQDVSKTPMFGSATLSKKAGTSTPEFTAIVNVFHMLSKVHLQALNVQFNENGAFKDASFTPTDIFMVNVPNDVKFNVTSDTDESAWTNTSTFLHGWGNDDYTVANVSAAGMGDYKKYLTTGTLTPTELKGTSGSFGKEVYFYTLPNGKTDLANRTKLVIAGTFKNNDSDPGTKVYYPVPINAKFEKSGDVKPAVDGTTVYAVYPNKVYNCTVNIKAKGVSTPNESLEPQTASVTVIVKPYTPADQTTNFE
jgi:hypothetical protein